VAIEVSQAGTASSGGMLGTVKKGDLSPRLEEIAFTLPVGSVSELLEMPYGFHIVKVEAREPDRFTPLDEVRDTLRKALENKKFAEERDKFLDKARADAEWCVKPSYRNRLAIPSPECPSL
jgi:parvulin-like peptidyl-prolyl isomerase